MINRTIKVMVVCVVWVGLSADLLANSAPVVSNVTASQRTDVSKKVDIGYDLTDADGDACTVSVQVSNDAGATWTVPASTFDGGSAVGAGVTPGTGKLIVWDSKIDQPGVFGSQFKVRVCADDGYSPPPPSGMVLIPAGSFEMGNVLSATGDGYSDELPVHTVTLSAFYMDRCEVTNQQYAAALNWAKAQGNLITVTSGVVYKYNSGTSYPYCSTTSTPTGYPNYGEYSRITWNGTTFGVTSGKENHPMVLVSWYGSVAYANWRSGMQGKPLCYDLSTWNCLWNSGYRLPTEAEWEKAARGGVAGHRFPWSDTDTIQHARANYYSYWSGGIPYYFYDTSPTSGYHPTFGTGVYPYTSPVGYFAANGYGLHDMAGNVWEWCNDWYGSYPADPQTDPRGPVSGTYRVLRGGGWTYNAHYCRVAYRNNHYPAYRSYGYGLRLAAPAALESP